MDKFLRKSKYANVQNMQQKNCCIKLRVNQISDISDNLQSIQTKGKNMQTHRNPSSIYNERMRIKHYKCNNNQYIFLCTCDVREKLKICKIIHEFNPRPVYNKTTIRYIGIL